MKIQMLTMGIAATNCFILGDPTTKDAVVFDPSDNARAILESAKQEDWQIKAILCTHGHFDHVLAVGDLKAMTDAPFYLHPADVFLLEQLPERMLHYTGQSVPPAPPPDVLITPGQPITIGPFTFEVRHTPGHTPGSVTFVLQGQPLAFSGDVIFVNGVGRTDFPYGDQAQLMHTIFEQILTLPDEYALCVGHGYTTTVGSERQTNPYVQDWMQNRRQR